MSVTIEKLEASKEVVMNLAKDKGLDTPKVRVVLAMDYSGSMRNLYEDGFVQHVFERIVPVAMAFDDDGEMPVYIFNDSYARIQPDVNAENVVGYVDKEIRSKYSFSGTKYSPVLEAVVNQMLKDIGSTQPVEEKKSGFLSRMFGGEKKTDIPQTCADMPTLLIVITDGDDEDTDKPKATKVIVEASKHALFIQFIPLKHARGEKPAYLDKLDTMSGRFLDNVNCSEEVTEEDFKTMTDEDFYGIFLEEFPGWYAEAEQKGLFKNPTPAPVITATTTTTP